MTLEGPRWLSRGLMAWTGWIQGHAPVVVLAFLGGAALVLAYVLEHLTVNTSTTDMISPRLEWRQDFIEYQAAFPQLVGTLLVVIDGANADVAERARSRLADRLAENTELFPTIFTPGGGEHFERSALLYLDTAELEDLADRLAEIQPFLGRLARDQTVGGFTGMLGEALEAASAGTPIELAQILDALTMALDASARDAYYRLSWLALMGASDSQWTSGRRLLVLQPQLRFDNFAPAREAIETVRLAARELALDPDHGVHIRLTGPVALEYEELRSVSRGASVTGALALFMVAAVLFWGLRSLRLVLASLLTLVTGLIATAGFATLALGELNLISVAFAVLYIGLGIDFAIHLCLRYSELVAEGHAPALALRTAAGDVGASLVLCAVTTSVGFFAFFPTTFSGVAELGLISGVGMYISLLSSLTLLPALLTLLPPRLDSQAPPPLRALARLETPFRYPRRLLASAVVLALLSLALLPQVRFDPNPLNLREPDTESVQTFRELLEESTSAPLTLALLTSDLTASEAVARDLEALPAVDRAVTLADFVPSDQQEKLELIGELSLLLGPDLVAESSPSPGPERELQALEALEPKLAAAAVGSDPELAATAGRSLQSLRRFLQAARERAAPARSELLEALRTSLLEGFPEQLQRLSLALLAAPIEVADLPPDLVRRWRAEDGRQRVEVFPVEDLADNGASRRFVEQVRAVAPHATGIPVIQIEAGDAVVHAFRQALVSALLVVSLLLIALMRSVRATLMVLAPVLLAALLTAAVTVLIGMPFNFANVIALPLLLGVGVDNGIHLVHRHTTAPPVNGHLLGTSTARAIVFSALTTVASFGNLAASPHPGTASMGLLLAIGMTLIVACTLLVLPALLHLGDAPR